MNREELRELIDRAGLSRVADLIIELSQPCLRFKTEPCAESEFPLGASRVGGRPDLPAGMEWPLGRGYGQEKQSLSFMAQFNLAELARFPACADLPPTGLLSFFYGHDDELTFGDPKERGRWQVVYNCDLHLSRLEFPTDIDHTRHASCKPVFREGFSFPDHESLPGARLRESLEEDEYGGFLEMSTAFTTQEEKWPWTHQLLGIPRVIQGVMETECQFASHGLTYDNSDKYQSDRAKELRPRAADWRLLFQLDSDENAKISWPCGYLYYWIRKSDLRESRFDRTWIIFQST